MNEQVRSVYNRF